MICRSCQGENPDSAEVCFHCGKGLFALTQGAVLDGRYEILEMLGKGGMGIVYKAHDRALDETVALKVLRPDVTGTAQAAKRFLSEIKLARKVRHKNVCGIHEYGQEGPLQFIAMEYVDGVDLSRVLKRQGALPPLVAFDVAIQIAKGLQAIHAEGIVHRDLKTANIMRGQTGTVRLMDFGIAKRFEGDATRATATGMSVGTPEYMSPEQVRGEALDARSDIYALGVVIFELFTGDVPFLGDTPVATFYKQLHDPPPLEGPSAEAIPATAIPVLQRALAKSREERFSSAAEVLQALRRARSLAFPDLTPDSGAQPSPAIGDEDDAADAVSLPLPNHLPMRDRVSALPTAEGRTLRGPLEQPRPAREAPTQVVPTPRTGSVRTVRRTPRPAVRPAWTLARLGLLSAGLAIAGLVAWRFQVVPPGGDATSVSPRPSPTAIRAPASVAALTDSPTLPSASPAANSPPPAVPEVTLETKLTDLDQLAERDPEKALGQVLRLAKEHPRDSAVVERSSRYRRAAAERLVASGAQALQQANASESAEKYQQALRHFERALQLQADDPEARRGYEEARRGREQLRSPSDTVAFVQGETVFTPPASAASPPGMGAAPPGVTVRPAQPPAPKAQLVIEVSPPQVRVGQEYVVRYSLFNLSATPLIIGSLSVRNTVGAAVTGGSVEPQARAVQPQTRTLLLEARGKWSYDRATEWTSSVTVVLDDGSVYGSVLRTRR